MYTETVTWRDKTRLTTSAVHLVCEVRSTKTVCPRKLSVTQDTEQPLFVEVLSNNSIFFKYIANLEVMNKI